MRILRWIILGSAVILMITSAVGMTLCGTRQKHPAIARAGPILSEHKSPPKQGQVMCSSGP
jgi:hypothetical protein